MKKIGGGHSRGMGGEIIECNDKLGGDKDRPNIVKASISSDRDAFGINSSNPFPGNSAAISPN